MKPNEEGAVQRGPNYDWKHEAKHYQDEAVKYLDLSWRLDMENDRLQSEIDELKAKLDLAVEALKFTKEMCLCRRYKTEGFDYGETHRKAGKAGMGERWLTPQDKVIYALSKINKEGG